MTVNDDTDDQAVTSPETALERDLTHEQPKTLSADVDPESAPESDPEPSDDDEGSKASREAKKYRLRAKEAEGKVEELTATVDALRKQVIDEAARLDHPDALWATGVTPADLYDDDGNLDRDALRAAIDKAREQFGARPRPRAPKPDPNQGKSTGAPFGGPSMADVIAGNK